MGMSSTLGAHEALKIHPTTNRNSCSSSSNKVTSKTSVEQSKVSVNISSHQLEDVQNGMTKDAAWQERGGQNSKSLGRDTGLRIPRFTSMLNTDDYESEDEKSSVSLRTRSLGQKEMNAVKPKPISATPVSQRSAAYKEMVASSANNWKGKTSTKSSIIKLKNSSTVSRIETNPFFQLDRNSKVESIAQVSPGELTKKKEVPPSSITRSSTSAVCMSVQMRIKIWTDKEEQARTQAKLLNRKSLQHTSLLGIEIKDEEESNSLCDRGAQSDDELSKSTSNMKGVKSDTKAAMPTRVDHGYEVIDDVVKESVRLAEASSSSSLSSESSLGDSPLHAAKQDMAQVQERSPDRESPPINIKVVEVKSKKHRWKLMSPLSRRKKSKDELAKQERIDDAGSKSNIVFIYKRPFTKKRAISTGTSKDDDDASTDDVFSPVRNGGRNKVNEEAEQKRDKGSARNEPVNEECSVVTEQMLEQAKQLPSTFDRTCKRTSGSKKNRSISHDIRSIINSLGNSEDSVREKMYDDLIESPCSIIVNDNCNGNSESGKCRNNVPIIALCRSYKRGEDNDF